MMDPKITQELKETIRQLEEQDEETRANAARHLGEMGIVHPRIIKSLESLNQNDPSGMVREATASSLEILKAIQERLQPTLPENPDRSAGVVTQARSESENESKIIELLTAQNQMLELIHADLLSTMEKAENQNNLRARITDVNMSVGAMIGFMFKWLFASIPVGIVVGIIWSMFGFMF